MRKKNHNAYLEEERGSTALPPPTHNRCLPELAPGGRGGVLLFFECGRRGGEGGGVRRGGGGKRRERRRKKKKDTSYTNSHAPRPASLRRRTDKMGAPRLRPPPRLRPRPPRARSGQHRAALPRATERATDRPRHGAAPRRAEGGGRGAPFGSVRFPEPHPGSPRLLARVGAAPVLPSAPRSSVSGLARRPPSSPQRPPIPLSAPQVPPAPLRPPQRPPSSPHHPPAALSPPQFFSVPPDPPQSPASFSAPQFSSLPPTSQLGSPQRAPNPPQCPPFSSAPLSLLRAVPPHGPLTPSLPGAPSPSLGQ